MDKICINYNFRQNIKRNIILLKIKEKNIFYYIEHINQLIIGYILLDYHNIIKYIFNIIRI